MNKQNELSNIIDITSEKLKKGVYKQVFPEYYQLKKVTENGPWHLNQNVFDHVVAVFASLEEVLKLKFLEKNEKEKIIKYLNKKIGKYLRKELLIIATLLHDIAKADLLIKDKNENTQCPGHEVIGASMVKNFVSRFRLDQKGTEQVTKLVHYHGDVNDFLILIMNKGNESRYLKLFKEIVGDIDIKLLLFMYADMKGSDLRITLPGDFKKREKTIISALKYLL